MVFSLNIPWKRYGLIAELAERLKGKCPQFGKTALQKLVFLLQEVYGIDCDYDFSLYTYGPYTSSLQQDLDVVENLGGVVIARVCGGTGGYCILPGDRKDALLDKAGDFLRDPAVVSALDRLTADFGVYWAKDLELISTVVYVARDLKRRSGKVAHEQLFQTVRQIKPKFTESEISSTIDGLQSKNLIEVDLKDSEN